MAAERLTEDLLVEILSRVPARSICRFKCVSKHWLSLIDHPDHRKQLLQTLAGFFYTSSNDGKFLLDSPVRFASVSGKSCPPIDTSFAFLPVHRGVQVLDCCNGLLLCSWSNVSAPGDELCYIVCNPATEGWVQLPDRGHAGKVDIVRLGFDPAVSSHFYVFVLLENVDFKLGGMDVFSSETRRWVHKEKGWKENMKLFACRLSAVFLNGCLHFHAHGEWSSLCIGVVDTEGKTWTNLGIPGHSQGYLHYANFEG